MNSLARSNHKQKKAKRKNEKWADKRAHNVSKSKYVQKHNTIENDERLRVWQRQAKHTLKHERI